MNAVPADSGSTSARTATSAREAPQLRTILLTDLVDSTALVERLGDEAAADLFRAHDHLVLGLQQDRRGRLIDRSDGMLLLFERPIDGLGFALDYNRGLADLGREHGVELKARAGLHVGEVLTWRNSDEAVKVGAKPLEVEGLAKPMAARLMTMARPGQILLSAIAEPLAHRAARELGERGQHLLWKSHGRWRFKGVPNSQQIFEVGEPGIAPLRIPQNSPKAWRDLPLWRRPAALAAEFALVAIVAVGLWFVTRPQPAIAFHERDWVVLADVRNLTGETLLDDSLEQAFRISLEQSRHVNVLSELKTRETLARMQREPDTALDRAIASEVAIRDGARAVILPTVAEVGGRLRVSAEVIDPHSETTVYAEYMDGKGLESALASIDTVAGTLRNKLGEAMEAVQRDSKPLPEATTGNLDALRAYALGHDALAGGEASQALRLYQQAVAIDPLFALAHIAIARVHVAMSDRSAALPHLDRALSLKSRLPERDRLYLEAWEAELRLQGKRLARWNLLASMYPDYYAGQANASWYLYVNNDYAASLELANAANVSQVPLRGILVDQIGRIQLAQGKIREALATFERADRLQAGLSDRRRAAALALQGRHSDAVELLNRMESSGFGSDDPIRYIDLVTLALDQARWSEARRLIGQAIDEVESESAFLTREFRLIAASVQLVSDPEAQREAEFLALARAPLHALEQPGSADTVDDAMMALVAAYLAQRAGYQGVAEEVLTALSPWERRLSGTVFKKMAAVVRAEGELLSGDPEAAVQRLRPELDGTELVQARVTMMHALVAAGRGEDALIHAQWLLDNRGRAYVEANASQVLQALNVADTRRACFEKARLLVGTIGQDQASAHVATCLKAWPEERLPDYLLRRVEDILPASKQKMTL